MGKQIDMVLNGLMEAGVEYNTQENSFFGVLFQENSALVSSIWFIIRVENLAEKPQDEFFSYFDNAWTKNRYPVGAETLLPIMYDPMKKHTGKIIVPLPNLINHLNKLTEKEKKLSRVIIAPDIVDEASEEFLAKFTFNGQRHEFNYPGLDKPCYVAPDSKFPEQLIKGDVVYKCKAIAENNEAYFLNVISPYSKVKIGLHYSDAGFIPTDINAISRLEGMSEDRIMRLNSIEPAETFRMCPVHLDCEMLYDLSKVFALANATYIEINVPDEPNVPVVIRNIKNHPDDLEITIMQATLDPFYGAQKR